VFGNGVRVLLTGTMAVLMLTQGVTPAIYVLGLASLSVNRFLLAGLSAGMPRVVQGELLLTANALTPTLGAGAAFLGGGVSFLLSFVMPAGRIQDATALTCACIVMGCASLLGLRMSRTLLGPLRPAVGSIGNELVVVARGLVDGARYRAARRTPGQALLVMALHRFLYGVVFIASILMSRNLLSDPGDPTAGLGIFALVIGATGVGGALATVLTAVLARRMTPQSWIAVMLLVAGISQLILVPEPGFVAVVTAAALLGLAAQGAKIAVDTIVQRDSEDAYRGRAFAFYDVLYNAAFVGAAALAAFLVPDAGWSPGLFVALSLGYVAAALLFGMGGARTATLARQTHDG